MAILRPYEKYYPVKYDYLAELPDSWQLLPNIGIFQERIERGYENEELLSVTIGRGVIRQSELEKKDSSTLDKSKYLLVYPDDLVYSMRFRQGASGYSNYKGIVSPACTVLKPRKNVKLNSRFYFYMFRTGFYKNYVERFAYGIADGQIPLRYIDFKRMYSVVPPLEIQNRIVEYLDKKNSEIDKFIQNKERLIELLEERKSTIINEAICGRLGYNKERKIVSFIDEDEIEFTTSKFEWIGKTPKNWQYKKLPWVSKFQEGPGLRTWQFTNEGVKVICVTNITEGGIDFSLLTRCISEKEYKNKYKHFTINKGDYLLASSGASWGKVAEYIEEENVILNTSTIRFNSSNPTLYSKQFIKWAMKSRYMSEHLNLLLTGSCQPNFGPSHLQKLILNIPPIQTQKLIVEFIETEIAEISNSILLINKEISTIKEYRETLITDLVTGKRSVPQS